MRIAIATSDEPKNWYKDINLLIAALAKNGATGEEIIWDDPHTDWALYDTVLIDSIWDYTEKHQQFLSWCESITRTSKLINPFEIIKLNSSKDYLLTLNKTGINTPKTSILKAASQINADLFSIYKHQVVIKPVVGASGVDTFLFNSFEEATSSQVFVDLLSKQDLLVQDYVKDIKELGELSAIFISGQLSHCVLKRATNDEFRVQQQYGGTVELVSAPKGVRNIYEQVAAALDVKPVYMRLDFVPTDNPIIMEVEMVEPNKYFSLCPVGAGKLAQALVAY